MNQLTFSRFKIIFLLLPFLILGGWLIFQSQSITTWDQGDYGRVLSSILSGPADGKEYRHWEKPTMEWAFKDPIDSIWQVNNFAEVYFNLHANFQKMFRSTFSLPLLSLISKLVSLFLLALLARSISRTIGWIIYYLVLIMFARISILSYHIHSFIGCFFIVDFRRS